MKNGLQLAFSDSLHELTTLKSHILSTSLSRAAPQVRIFCFSSLRTRWLSRTAVCFPLIILLNNIHNMTIVNQKIELSTQIQLLRGVGPKFGAKLSKLGIETVQDLLLYYPRTYRDFSNTTKLSELESKHSGNFIAVRGQIVGIVNKKTSKRRFTITEAVIEDGTGSLKVVWFNQPFLQKMLPAGREVILYGKLSHNSYTGEVILESPERSLSPRIDPIYSETEGISSKYINRLVFSVKELAGGVVEFLPENLLEIPNFTLQISNKIQNEKITNSKTNSKLLSIRDAIENIHFPKNNEMLERAKRRLAFDELFLIALKAQLSKEEIKKENAPALDYSSSAVEKFIGGLPFELTGDQRKALDEILGDITSVRHSGLDPESIKIPKQDTDPVSSTGRQSSVRGDNKAEYLPPMNRLLNGDVGSGKTIVAAIAAYTAVLAGYRVAIMAPTSILAVQHYESFSSLFIDFDVSIGLWTSDRQECFNQSEKLETKGKKNSILKANIIIGTQALIQKGVELQDLGLVVVDEQHRFGVKQRAALLEMTSRTEFTNSNDRQTALKMRPHFLSMTATPIPRTLHLALFGDLDLSVIREKPRNRKEIKTRLVDSYNRNKAYEFIRAHLHHGRQVFVICPLIEEKNDESNDSKQKTQLFEEDRKTVVAEYEKLQKVYPEFQICMLHGKLKPKEKDQIMADFANGETNILVSTSVVEVGVDVPNATVMVIEDAERFGLSQLHQFRGRVGRGVHQSFCLLFSTTSAPIALKRLKSLEMTNDGFKLAEVDLETRGPGELFGTIQSGEVDLRMASFSDRELIAEASTAAKELVKNDPELSKHIELKKKLKDFFEAKHLE